MARNVEIKARAKAWDSQLQRAQALADRPPRHLLHEDTFFACPSGRLKLRDFGDGRGQLIYYNRPAAAGPKTSVYALVPVTDPDGLRALLAAALGATGRVSKHRTVYRVGQTRIHFDEVAGLGRFIELEVVLANQQDETEGARIAERLSAELGIAPADLVADAYVDLLAAGQKDQP